jgi:hypothetical protein
MSLVTIVLCILQKGFHHGEYISCRARATELGVTNVYREDFPEWL